MRSSIPTSEPGTLSPPAGLLPRVRAFAWDYLPIAVYLTLLTLLGVTLLRTRPEVSASLFGHPARGQMVGFVVITLPVALYFALSESSSWQATWGKRRRRLRVVGAAGARLSRPRSLARTGLKLVPWELAHTCVWQASAAAEELSPLVAGGLVAVWGLVGANVVSLWLSPMSQALYDRLAGTFVVKDGTA